MDKTLLKGLAVLEHVASAPGPLKLSQVANDLGLMKSNAHRVLRTLEHAGYVSQNARTKEFSVSLKLWELGSQIVDRLDLRNCASVSLREMANKSGESVHLSILDESDVIYIDKIDSPQPVAAYSRIGGRAPAYCVATGKAMLSELAEAELAPLLKNLKPHSINTITSMPDLLADLALTRERGYSINKGEWRESVWGLASAIRDSRGRTIAAVGVSGPEFRLSPPERTAELGELVKHYGIIISRQLGDRT